MDEHASDDRSAVTGKLAALGSPKRLRPRVVGALLLAAALAGVWLSHLGESISVRLGWWLVVVATGVLIGGLYWRLVVFDRSAFAEPAVADGIARRWRRVETVAVWTLAVAAGALTLASAVRLEAATVAFTAGVAALLVLWAVLTQVDDIVTGRAVRVGSLVVALVVLGAFAWLETGTGPVDWLVRFGHLGAIVLWFGGAAWHNVVVLPTLSAHPDAAGTMRSQARRFRRHLPVVVAVVLGTGVYQTGRLADWEFATLLDWQAGHLIGFKLLALTILTGLVVAAVVRGPE